MILFLGSCILDARSQKQYNLCKIGYPWKQIV